MKAVSVVLLMLFAKVCFAQEDCACSVKNLAIVQNHLDSLTKEDVQLLLCTFDESCANKVEFAQFSNEMLLEVLQRRSDLLIAEISQNKENINLAIILSEFESPIHDGFDVKGIINSVLALDDNEVKEQILKALAEAARKL